MRKKATSLYTLLFLLLGLIILTKTSFAASTGNPVFATIQYVQEKFDEIYNSLEPRLLQIEKEIAEIKETINANDSTESIIGAMPDQNTPQLGLINFSGNAKEYSFWFTPNSNVLSYVAGNTYNVVYKVEVEDPTQWCGQTAVVDRPPYNLFAEAGSLVYFKITDITTGSTLCF